MKCLLKKSHGDEKIYIYKYFILANVLWLSEQCTKIVWKPSIGKRDQEWSMKEEESKIKR